jgi:hypothetical protein
MDKDYLINVEYIKPENYRSRSSIIYDNVRKGKTIWQWTAEQYDFENADTILEIGRCREINV